MKIEVARGVVERCGRECIVLSVALAMLLAGVAAVATDGVVVESVPSHWQIVDPAMYVGIAILAMSLFAAGVLTRSASSRREFSPMTGLEPSDEEEINLVIEEERR